MKERDFSEIQKEERTVPAEELFEKPMNRKERRDMRRENGGFKRRKKTRWA